MILLAAPLVARGQLLAADHSADAKDAGDCYAREVKSLPGSHAFAADFLEVIATDASARAKNRNVIWGLTADLSGDVPAEERALYISKSTDGGVRWMQVARVEPRYFDSGIDEGLRNGLEVVSGGTEFVLTTQKGAFQVLPRAGADALVRAIAGPRVPHERPWVSFRLCFSWLVDDRPRAHALQLLDQFFFAHLVVLVLLLLLLQQRWRTIVGDAQRDSVHLVQQSVSDAGALQIQDAESWLDEDSSRLVARLQHLVEHGAEFGVELQLLFVDLRERRQRARRRHKLARFAWAVLAKSEAYRPPLSAVSTEALACN